MAASARVAPVAAATLGVREVAVIDLGSNTARLDVFEVTEGGALRTVFESKEVPRLGEGVGQGHRLSREAMERGIATLRRFARELEVWGRPAVVAIATSAIREAENGREFLAQVKAATGLEVNVVSGAEEGRYAYLGTAAAWPLHNDLIVDVGGGSVQVVATRRGRFDRAWSAPLGVLSMTERFLGHDPPRRKEIDELRQHLRNEFRDLPKSPGASRRRLFGIGGTLRCLARVAILLTDYPVPQVHGYPLGARELRAIGSILFEMPAERRKDVPGISGHRADVIPAGVVVAEELLRAAQVESLIVSGNGIRQGVAIEAARISVPAPAGVLARRSGLAAARRFGFSVVHAEDVRATALRLFDRLKSRYGWSDDDRLAVSVGGWMHDAGTAIEEWRHPFHSAYILRHTTVHGVGHREILMAALAAYLHEGDPAPDGWRKRWKAVLSSEEVERAMKFGVVLAAAEELAGLDARFGAGASGRIRVRMHHPAGPAARARAIDRLARRLKNGLGVEVETARGRQ